MAVPKVATAAGTPAKASLVSISLASSTEVAPIALRAANPKTLAAMSERTIRRWVLT
jgi:hypothetical protein